MTAGPEHFADIAARLFPRLKETAVPPPTDPRSAEDHYLHAEELVACAQVALEANDFAREHALSKLADTHYTAAMAAMAIWPHDAHVIAGLTAAVSAAQDELHRWRRGYTEAEKYWKGVAKPDLSSPAPEGDLDVTIGAGAYRARIRTALLEPGEQ
jgi:hypothetical protein